MTLPPGAASPPNDEDLPGQVDPAAVARIGRRLARSGAAPWLHEEVARRLGDKLDFLRLQPATVVEWWAQDPAGSPAWTARYPQAARHTVQPGFLDAPVADEGSRGGRGAGVRAWLDRLVPVRTRGPEVARHAERDQPGLARVGAQLLWANLALHADPRPLDMLRRWHAALAVGGFVMFSCFGPDTMIELRALYDRLGWGPPTLRFGDMHDVGDLLVQAGFGDPVVDMEHLRLTWPDVPALLQELRSLGGNAHPARFPALRTPRWRSTLIRELERDLIGPDGRVGLTFEIVYGHAVRPQPVARVEAESHIPLDQMRAMVKLTRRKD